MESLAGRPPQARDREGRRPSRAGAWPSGKARDFGSRIRRFESSRPNHIVDGNVRVVQSDSTGTMGPDLQPDLER